MCPGPVGDSRAESDDAFSCGAHAEQYTHRFFGVPFTTLFDHTATDPQFDAEMSDVTRSEKAELHTKRLTAIHAPANSLGRCHAFAIGYLA